MLETEAGKPAVYAAIAKVQGELARYGISKSRKNAQQGYAFRGIDDVYAALSPLLAEAGLCVIPRVLHRETAERTTRNGGALYFVTVHAEFDFVSVADGSKHTASTFGEASDSGDKATNKAMSAAYKYAAFMTFAIPTEGDNDADAHTPEPVHRGQPVAAAESPVLPAPTTVMVGPHRNITALKQAVRDFVQSIKEAGDLDTFDAVMAEAEPTLAQVRQYLPTWWNGGADIERTLPQTIDLRREELAAVETSGVPRDPADNEPPPTVLILRNALTGCKTMPDVKRWKTDNEALIAALGEPWASQLHSEWVLKGRELRSTEKEAA